jgi:hypothetical protein
MKLQSDQAAVPDLLTENAADIELTLAKVMGTYSPSPCRGWMRVTYPLVRSDRHA